MTYTGDAKIAVITGAASGIGAATSRSLAGRGFIVVGADVDRPAGEALFQDLGGRHRFRALDVTDLGAWRQLVSETITDFGGLDLLHLNAGVMSRPAGAPLFDDPLAWFSDGAYRKVSEVNLAGVVRGIIAAIDAPGLRQVIITASGAALLPLEMDPFYTMTKFGALGLGLALEPTLAARGIRLDVICPGAIDTGLTAPDVRAQLKQESPDFIGEAVATLATTAERGPVWLAFSEAQGLQRHDMPGLPGSTGALDVVEAAPAA